MHLFVEASMHYHHAAQAAAHEPSGPVLEGMPPVHPSTVEGMMCWEAVLYHAAHMIHGSTLTTATCCMRGMPRKMRWDSFSVSPRHIIVSPQGASVPGLNIGRKHVGRCKPHKTSCASEQHHRWVAYAESSRLQLHRQQMRARDFPHAVVLGRGVILASRRVCAPALVRVCEQWPGYRLPGAGRGSLSMRLGLGLFQGLCAIHD